jgi:hypothetical protein
MSLRRVLRAAKCASLVGCHETAVTDHIGHEDGGQPAFHSDLRRFGSSSLRQVVGLCREPGNGRVSATKRTSRLMIPPPAVEMARGTRPVAQEAKADPLHASLAQRRNFACTSLKAAVADIPRELPAVDDAR